MTNEFTPTHTLRVNKAITQVLQADNMDLYELKKLAEWAAAAVVYTTTQPRFTDEDLMVIRQTLEDVAASPDTIAHALQLLSPQRKVRKVRTCDEY